MLIFSKNVNRYLVIDFLKSLSRNTSMISPDLRKWKPEDNNNLVSTIEFGKIIKLPRHEKILKNHLTNI